VLEQRFFVAVRFRALDLREDEPFVWTATADDILRRVATHCDPNA
jgi:hypothetical protein